jgi:uncharacterized membrane protein YphA (DoxX/SURF4 family)
MAGVTGNGPVASGLPRVWTGHLARCLLGAIFLAAGFLKALDPAEFARQIAAYGLVGPGLASVAAPVFITLEFSLGVALVAGFRPRLMLTAGTLFLLGFIGLETYAISIGKTESCGCFGAYVQRTPQQVILEDLLFVGLALVALWGLRRWGGIPGSAPAITVLAAAALSFFFALASPYLPIDPIVTRLAVGRSLKDLGLAGRVPGLDEGRHLVALLDVTDPGAAELGARLNEIVEKSGGPGIVALTPATAEDAAAYLWSAAPAFDIHPVDRPVLKRLYRRLPRFFVVENGQVVAVLDDPPLAGLSLLSSEAS